MPSDICRSAYRSLAPAAAADIQPELLVLCGVHGLNLFVFCSDRLQARNFKLESEGETAASVLRPKKRKAEMYISGTQTSTGLRRTVRILQLLNAPCFVSKQRQSNIVIFVLFAELLVPADIRRR
ncbi:hypothetical protein NDU88_006830 [Pleurodeles waltl]|uniref:Uncharacterized protein n=1 Tax=Pleurodeles waltl TaxID=8319 RepID=A0AAV7MDC9_PLEWA|nr:hypothetical protein NDU88_006830 [Pleurodeles waltl]